MFFSRKFVHITPLCETYTVCPKRHEIYFFAALLLVAACSNLFVEVGGPLSS